jgi:hypothetical protein
VQHFVSELVQAGAGNVDTTEASFLVLFAYQGRRAYAVYVTIVKTKRVKTFSLSTLAFAKGGAWSHEDSRNGRGRARAARIMRPHAAILLLLLAVCTSILAWAGGAAGYDAVRIVAPQHDATVHDNQGTLDVSVAVSPPLRSKEGDHIVLLLDGRVAASGANVHIRLRDVDRGTHTLRAQVVAADGALLLASPETSFHMWRASRLFPGRKN